MKVQEQANPNLPPVERGLTWRCASILSTGGAAVRVQDQGQALKHQVQWCSSWRDEPSMDGARVARTLSRTSTSPGQDVRAAEVRAVLGVGKQFSRRDFRRVDTNDLSGCRPAVGDLAGAGSTPTSHIMALRRACRRRSPTAAPSSGSTWEPGTTPLFAALPLLAQEKIKKSTQYQKDHLPARRWNFPPDEEGRQRPPSGRPPRWTSGTGRVVRLTFTSWQAPPRERLLVEDGESRLLLECGSPSAG